MSKAKIKAKKKSKAKTKKEISPVKIFEAYGDKQFFATDGTIISKLSDLPSALETMDDSSFQIHVNKEKNDFSNWIGDVFLNTKLAKKLNKIRDRKKLVTTLKKELKL